jgi:hypothetical protein
MRLAHPHRFRVIHPANISSARPMPSNQTKRMMVSRAIAWPAGKLINRKLSPTRPITCIQIASMTEVRYFRGFHIATRYGTFHIKNKIPYPRMIASPGVPLTSNPGANIPGETRNAAAHWIFQRSTRPKQIRLPHNNMSTLVRYFNGSSMIIPCHSNTV